jgi:hypothetical protein
MKLPIAPLSGIGSVAILALLFSQSTAIPREGKPMHDPQELKAQQFLDRIKAAQQAGSVAELLSIREDIKAAWEKKKEDNYFRVVRELCGALTSVNGVDWSRRDLIRKTATAAVDAPEDKPIGEEVKLLLFLQGDSDYIHGTLRGAEWQKERPIRVHRWLRTWRHLHEEKSRSAKEVDGPVTLNVEPPPGVGFPPGVSPKEIKDPVLRKQYEEAIPRNAEQARINRRKIDLKNLDALFTPSAKRYIIGAYTKSPYQTDELEKMLGKSGLDADTQAEILNEVKKQVEARKEREAKEPPPPHMQFTEPFVPPGAPTYHADPRLRIKVSFDLKAPLVDDVLHELRQATKVSLARADDIQNQYPSHASLSYRNVPAWQVMDSLAKSKRVEGRWEKDGDSYRLVHNGNPVDIPEASGAGVSKTSSGVYLTIALACGAVLVAVLLLLSRWRRANRQAGSNSVQ